MKSIIGFATRYPKIVVSVIISVSLPMIYFAVLAFIHLNTNLLFYLPQSDPSVIDFKKIGDEFGGTDTAVIGIVDHRGIFSQEVLEEIDRLCEELACIKLTKEALMIDATEEEVREIQRMTYEELPCAITNVMSLTEIIDIQAVTDERGRRIVDIRELIEEIPETEEEQEELRKRTLESDLYRGTIISIDGTKAAIICRLSPESIQNHDAAEDITQVVQKANFDEVYLAGVPITGYDAKVISLRDLSILLPFVILLVLLILFYSFRSIRGIILPLVTVIASVIWSCGLINLLGLQLSLVSIILPTILVAVGSAYGIHAINKYYEELHEIEDKEVDRLNKEGRQSLVMQIHKVGVPIVMAGVTTMVGFLSLASSDMPPIRDFGIFSAVGVLFALVITLLFIPAVLTLLKLKKSPGYELTESKTSKITLITRFLNFLSQFIYKRRRVFLILVLLLTGIFAYFIRDLDVESNQTEWYQEDSSTRQAINFIAENFGGYAVFMLQIKGEENIILEPAVLNTMDLIQGFTETQLYGVSEPMSIVDMIKRTNEVMMERESIPTTYSQVQMLYDSIGGEDIMEQMVNEEKSKALIQARIMHMDTDDIKKMISQTMDYITNHLGSCGENYDCIAEVAMVDREEIEQYTDLFETLLTRQREQMVYNIEKSAQILDEAQLNEVLKLFQQSLSNQLNEHYTNQFMEKLKLYIDFGFIYRIEDHNVKNDLYESIIDNLDILITLDDQERRQRIIEILTPLIPEEILSLNPRGVNQAAFKINNWLEYAITDSISMELRDHLLERELIVIEAGEVPTIDWQTKAMEDLIIGLSVINNEQLLVIKKEVEESSAKNLDIEYHPMEIKISGIPVIYKAIDEQLFRSQLLSLLISLGLVFVLLTIEFKSVRRGLISLTPIVMTIIFNFGLMSMLNIALDIATTMLTSIAIGIGIDYTIHFLSRFNKEHIGGLNEKEALERTHQTAGRAIIYNALTVGGGFAILGFSQMVPLAYFGLLVASTMLVSSMAALTVLPSLILTFPSRFEAKEETA